jgi:hypothetical protein
MISKAIDKLIEISKPVEFQFDGRTYVSKQIHPVKLSEPALLKINTLTGLADYLHDNNDNLDTSRLVLHIVSHDMVSLLGPIYGPFLQRNEYIRATCHPDTFPFGIFIDPESFIIKLQAMFQQDDTMRALLAVVGNIKDERNVTIGDDGISQQITVRVGIARLENTKLPNPITLIPYRTFAEVEQPASQFVHRIRSDGADMSAGLALFEADGSRWKLQAIQNIKEWLTKHVDVPIQILA